MIIPTYRPDDINIQDKYGMSLLHNAITQRDTRLALSLIENGIDCDLADDLGRTALHYAASRNDYALSESLVLHGANVNALDFYGNNPLWTVVLNPDSNMMIIKLLIEAGSDKNHKNKVGRSVVDAAIRAGDNDIIAAIGARNTYS